VPAAEDEASPVEILSDSGRVNRRGKVAVRILCPEEAGICDGKLTLRQGGRKAGSKGFDLDGGDTKTVRVKLRRRALNALEDESRTFRVRVLARDAQGVAARTRGDLQVAKL
jgi:hypothetical protein